MKGTLGAHALKLWIFSKQDGFTELPKWHLNDEQLFLLLLESTDQQFALCMVFINAVSTHPLFWLLGNHIWDILQNHNRVWLC